MAVRYLYIAAPHLPDLARENSEEDERLISGAARDHLGAFRGFAFALLIEAAMVLLGGVGWELWRMAR